MGYLCKKGLHNEDPFCGEEGIRTLGTVTRTAV